ncbi:ThiF family adenylyltransferase [Robertmurraya beringensis]|uniref:ThiF family adenylyltransferase n=1 Tax=Robertmurraya beringensis TaxID=641660 RepID=A0ABV6KT02_9BACI
MLKDTDIFKIRDAVDIYVIGEDILQIYFMNTRRQLQFKANKFTLLLIECIDGKKTILDIKEKLEEKINKEIELEGIKKVFTNLFQKGVIVENKPNLHQQFISDEARERYNRQINFFGDFLLGASRKYESQQKVQESSILIFGCGAVGGWMAAELAMSGVEHFILFDGDVVEKSDISRHIFFKEKFVGIPKVDALEKYLLNINPLIKVEKYQQFLMPDTSLVLH